MRIRVIVFLLLQFLLHASAEPLNSLTYSAELDSGAQGPYPVHKFHTSEAVVPSINFVEHSAACRDGLAYFLAPRGHKISRPGPVILDENGTLIWSKHFSNTFGGQAYDFRVQRYQGKDVLTFWAGDDRIRGHGAGHYYMLNSSYDVVQKIGAANGKFADLHEFTILPEGTALLIVFEVTKADTRPLGRTFNDVWNQAIWDCIFQEINIETGEAIFEWRASEHMNMTLTYNKMQDSTQGTREQPYDWSHMNSVMKDDLGNYLISIRNTHSILYIDGQTKDILWTLGGKANSFKDLSDGHAINFAWQHHANFVPSTAFPKTYTAPRSRKGITTRLMTLFDNAALDWNYEYGPSQSRVLLLELTYPTHGHQQATSTAGGGISRADSSGGSLSKVDAAKVAAIAGSDNAYTVQIVREYLNPTPFYSGTQGSVQLLPPSRKNSDSRLLVGWGVNAVATVFHYDGSVACDWHFAARSTWERSDVQTYRIFKSPWVGKPEQPPDVAISGDKLFVSWNGATEVHEWLLQSHPIGIDDQGWQDVVSVPKEVFETQIDLFSTEYDISRDVLRVQAIDKKGNTLASGTSAPIRKKSWTDTAKAAIDIRARSWQSLFVWTMVCLNVLYFLYRQVTKRSASASKGKSRVDNGHVD